MKNIVLGDIESVQYQDAPLARDNLSNIHVIFGKAKSGAMKNYFGPGLTLALALLKDQFPPETEAERSLVERPVRTPIDFDIDPNTLEPSAPLEKLKKLQYVELMAALKQAEDFGYFSAGDRSFRVDRLREAIQTEIHRQRPQA